MKRWQTLALTAIIAVAAFFPFLASPIFLLRGTQVVASILAFAGLHVLTGKLGLLSLGQGALVGIGAVAGAHAMIDLGVPYLLIPVPAAIVGFGVGVALGIPSVRLPGPYLALLTLSLAVALPILMRRIDGPLGIPVGQTLSPPGWTGLDEGDDGIWQYLLVLAVAVAVLAPVAVALRGRLGRTLAAVRDEPEAAAAFGIPVRRTQILGVGLASSLAATSGALLVFATPFVSHDQFPVDRSLQMFALVLALGSSSLLASVPAAFFLVLVPVWLRDAGWVVWEPVIYAVVLLVMTRLSHGRGLADLVVRLRNWSPRRPVASPEPTRRAQPAVSPTAGYRSVRRR